MKTIEIWEYEGKEFQGKPCQLLVAFEAENRKVKVSIRSGANPFPFRDIEMCPKDACNVSPFLKNNGWKRVSHFYL